MRSTFEFCLPKTKAPVPDRPNRLHEVKDDGMMVILDGYRAGGHD